MQLEGGGPAWRVAKAQRQVRWEASTTEQDDKKAHETRTHKILTQAMDNLIEYDLKRSWKEMEVPEKKEILEKATKPKAEGGTDFISLKQRAFQDSAQRHGRVRQSLEDFLSSVIRGEAEFGALLMQSGAEIERLMGAHPLPRKPLFREGQSVMQWWAVWMKDAPLNELPGSYAKRKRPAWFKADVLVVEPEPRDIVYCGILFKSVFTARAH